MLRKLVQPYSEWILTLFRVFVATLFLQHGLMKFGFLGGTAAPLASLYGVAGVIEVVVGVLVTLGLFTRYLSLLAAGQMVVAYFMSHFSMEAMVPIQNKGELALIYFASFLLLASLGAGKYSLDALWKLD